MGTKTMRLETPRGRSLEFSETAVKALETAGLFEGAMLTDQVDVDIDSLVNEGSDQERRITEYLFDGEDDLLLGLEEYLPAIAEIAARIRVRRRDSEMEEPPEVPPR